MNGYVRAARLSRVDRHGVERVRQARLETSLSRRILSDTRLQHAAEDRFINMIASLRSGKAAGPNPWKATSLEWQTPDTPPKHGNWGHDLPVVHRWAYDYSVPGYGEDYIPQNVPADQAPAGRDHGVEH